MQTTTIKQVFLTLILASALPLAACGKNETPTSPTQPGPTVADTPPPTVPTPTPEPTPTPTPTPTPPPTDNRPIETISGPIANLSRSGPGDLNAQFRIDDFTIVRATADTVVMSGSMTGQTDFLREHQTVTAEGRRDGGFLDATRITITAQAP